MRRILDLGTGTGCILFSLLTEFSNATGVGIDNSEKAIQVARENGNVCLDGPHRWTLKVMDFTQVDFAASLRNCQQPFDLIVSNPPYIAEGDTAVERTGWLSMQ